MDTKRGIGRIIFGIILGLTGVGLMIYGNSISDDYKRQFKSYASSGHKDNTGEILNYFGIALIVIGVIIVIIGIIAYAGNNKTPLSGIVGKFVSENGVYQACFYSNGKCVWQQKNDSFMGKYRMTGANKWRISFNDETDAFGVSLDDDVLHVIGRAVDTYLYRA